MGRKNKISERIGMVGLNNYGSTMEIVEYIDAHNILVKFEHGNMAHTQWGKFLVGNVRNVYDRTVYGIGYIGEGNYVANINRKMTHQYITWLNMLKRCYYENINKLNFSYINCVVAEEWHNFQNFAAWYDQNYYDVDGETMHLDKDILVKGNKIYSPETCVFVPERINKMFIKNNSRRGCYPIGVILCDNSIKPYYKAKCSDSNGKMINIGRYNTPEEAFLAYKATKEKIIKQVTHIYKDKMPVKVYESLMYYEINITD